MEGSDILTFYKPILAENKCRRTGKRSLLRDVLKFYKNRYYRFFYEHELIRQYRDEERPLIFIVGVPRSGTTLLYQLMARYFRVGYISNRMAGLWMAPVYALKRWMEKQKGGEASDGKARSFLGQTTGDDAPHEFGYFWQYWMKHQDHDELNEGDLQGIPWERIREELEALAGYAGAPFVIKNLNFIDHKIEWVKARIPSARFLHIERDPEETVHSILKARVDRYGREDLWWSIRPAGYERLSKRTPVEQAAFQYFYVLRSIEESLKEVGDDAKQRIDYEELKNDPETTLRTVKDRMDVSMVNREEIGREVQAVKKASPDPSRQAAIQEAIAEFREMDINELNAFRNAP